MAHSAQCGQTSVELMMVLGIALVILAVLVGFTTEQVSQVEKQQAIQVGQQSVARLVQEINSVYSLGPGKIREVTLPWPRGVDASASRLENASILLYVFDTPIVGTATPTLTGTLPTSPGLQRIRLLSSENTVRLSLVSIVSDTDSVYLAMGRDSNASTDITITNTSSSDANVSVSLAWTHTLVTASAGPSTLSLSSGQSANVDFNFSAGGTANGNYVGYLTLSADVGGNIESLVIPVNIEVFTGSQTLLTAIPSTISFYALDGDSDSSTFQLCNAGDSTISSISFTPSSGDAGDWVESLASISSLAPSGCQDVNMTVNVPADTNIGAYGGSVAVSDFTGANSLFLTLAVNVQGQKDYFTWDWNGTLNSGTQLTNFSLENSGTQSMIVDTIALRFWDTCDTDGVSWTGMIVDSNVVFSGDVNAGQTADVTNFSLSPSSSTSSTTLSFSGGSISNEGEQFQPIVTFGDGTVYTGTTYGDGCSSDITPPGVPLSFSATTGPDAESVVLSFTFPGDDNYTGTVSSVDIRYSPTSIDNENEFNSATPFTYTGSLLESGNTGSQFVTDLNVGLNYYFSIRFTDDSNNTSTVPASSPIARPWNAFRFSIGDFNIAPFARTHAGAVPDGTPDVNRFYLSNFTASSGDRNVYLRVADDTDSANTWKIALGFSSTRLTDVRIWYPVANTPGIPGTAPTYQGSPNSAYLTGLDLLSATIFPTTYRYNATSVDIRDPTRLYLDYMTGFSDLNVLFDQSDG